MSLAIVLELQIVQENDEVTYSTEVIARHKEENTLFISFSSYSLSLCIYHSENKLVISEGPKNSSFSDYSCFLNPVDISSY